MALPALEGLMVFVQHLPGRTVREDRGRGFTVVVVAMTATVARVAVEAGRV